MNRAIRRHGGEETILINTSISHAPTLKSIPIILISDWSYEHYIRQFLSRSPDYSERTTIKRDKQVASRASLNIMLFPLSSKRLSAQIPSAKFIYISHVTNIHPCAPMPVNVIRNPARSTNPKLGRLSIVYIGRRKYLPELVLLKSIMRDIKNEVNLSVDIIGIEEDEQRIFPKSDSQVRFHGYLRKNNSSQRNTFYQILDDADIMINLTSPWGPFSATLEAMYYYTAIISPPYDEFVEVFGEDAEFVDYIYNSDPRAIANQIRKLIMNPQLLRARKCAARIAPRVRIVVP